MALMSYLQRTSSGTYHFRRAIPESLRPFMPAPWTGKREWKRSLDTKSPSEAKRRFGTAHADCEHALRLAERQRSGGEAVTSAAITFTAEEVRERLYAELLAADEAFREDGDFRRQLQTPEERSSRDAELRFEAERIAPDHRVGHVAAVRFGERGLEHDAAIAYGGEPGEPGRSASRTWGVEISLDRSIPISQRVVPLSAAKAEASHLHELLSEYRRANAMRDTAIVRPDLVAFLKRHGASLPDEPEDRRRLELAALEAHVSAHEAMLQRHSGAIISTPKPETAKGPKLSEAYAGWKEGGSGKGAKKPGGRSAKEAGYAVRRFTEWHGDLRLADISREKARTFAGALARLPTRLPRDLLSLPLPKVLNHSKAKGEPPNATTVNKSLQLLGAIIANAMREGAMDGVAGFVNPFDKTVKIRVDSRAKGVNSTPFTPEELGAIFGSEVFRGGKRPLGGAGEASFWLPLIALLSGARLGELAQLRIADLKQVTETGGWVFDISTDGDRIIKTASSRRQVPVHPHLIEVGLLRYRECLLSSGSKAETTLWPDLKSSPSRPTGAAFTQWFGRWLEDTAKVTADGRRFHTFRHTFKRMCRDADLGEELHDALTGHSGGGVGRSYGGGFGLRRLEEAMARIEPPQAVMGLHWEASTEERRRRPVSLPPGVKKRKLTPRG